MPNQEQDMPAWDVALAALAAEEYRRKDAPLTLDDFQQLARQHAIRLDDIMETLFLLTINGEWTYSDRDGRPVEMTRETLDNLYVKRRLSEQDLQAFDGGWRPA